MGRKEFQNSKIPGFQVPGHSFPNYSIYFLHTCFQELFTPGIVSIDEKVIFSADSCDAILSAKTFQYDADLLFR
jgi:hypothetical protein